MRNMNKAIAIICLTAVMICMGYRIKARADGFPQVLAEAAASDLTSIQYAYLRLTSEQKDIASYLLGSFNHVYLMARGFSYSIPADESSWKAQFKALGNKVWSYATSSYNWRSRFNETFRQYLSSIVVYAASISTSFEDWYNNNSGSGQLYIPYNENALSAWTDFYNDPSGDGIASFGYQVTDWNSGNQYDFAFTGMPWQSGSDESRYNNFILNYNPVLFTNWGYTNSNTVQRQFVINIARYPDALYILRSNSAYTTYRYGFSNQTFGNVSTTRLEINTYAGRVGSDMYTQSETFSLSAKSITGQTNLNTFINNVFKITPFEFWVDSGNRFTPSNWYTFINHVYLVDDINTLANMEEVFDSTGLNINPPADNYEPYIIAPNDRLLFPTRPVGYDDPLGFWDIVIDNSVNENGDPAEDDDFHTNIINNNVINNYYVTNDDRINVPVEWFENDLSDQLATDTIPFLQFARDCIDTLGDLQVYFYGAIVFGLGGGILKKFLL